MWEERFRRLCEWKKVHGHCAVPIAQGELGTWVSKQRQLRKRDKLSKEKVDALNSLGFTWSTAEADWEDKFKRLCQWAKERGHASVPFNEGELGWWVNTQRQCKRKGKLSLTREERLCSLGFVWNPSNSRNKATAAAAAAAVEASSASSADTTPGTTPDKFEDANRVSRETMHLLSSGCKGPQHTHQVAQPIAPVPADLTAVYEMPQGQQDIGTGGSPCQLQPQTLLQTEGPLSPVPVALSQGLWSPIELASPILPTPSSME